MTTEIIKPDVCETMLEVRAGIDELDRRIVALFAERFRYMEAAARIKAHRNAVRDEGRKAQVLGNVKALAQEAGAPPSVVADVYEALIEGSIAYELDKFDARRPERDAAE